MLDTQKARILARLKNLIPNESDDRLSQLVDDAEEEVLVYTRRTQTPDSLLKTIGDLALISYNRLGTEGEAGRSEAGESYSFDLNLANIYKILNKNRIARVGGYAYETSKSDESDY